jgi:hypothetical protein
VRITLRRLRPAFLLVGATIALIVAGYLVVANADRIAELESYPRTNFSYIEEGLCVGGMLSESPEGVRAVLNVCETKDVYVAEVHRWEPIPDRGPPPRIDWLRSQVQFIDQQRKAGLPVYVHCRAGVNRSVTVVAAYLMWRDHIGRDEALALIKSKRPRASPYEVYRAFLAEWEMALAVENARPGR